MDENTIPVNDAGAVPDTADTSVDVGAETGSGDQTDTNVPGGASEDTSQGVGTGTSAVVEKAGKEAEENLVEETFKVMGQEVKVKIPKGMTKEQKDLLRKGMTFDREFSSLREREEKVSKIVDALKPGEDKMRAFKVLEAMGWETEDIVREFVRQKAEEEALTPEARELKNERASRAEIERRLAEREAALSTYKEREERANFANLFDGAVNGVLSKNDTLSAMPDGREVVASVLQTILTAGETPDAELVTKMAFEEIKRRKSVVKGMAADEILEMLGEEGLKKLREADVKRLQASQTVGKAEGIPQVRKRKEAVGDVITPKQFHELIDRRLKNA